MNQPRYASQGLAASLFQMSGIVVVAVVFFLFPRVIKHSAPTLRRVSLQREAGKRRKRGGRRGREEPCQR